jgi:hypothetical protein
VSVVDGLTLVAERRLVLERPRIRIPLFPGDRVVATAGSEVGVGSLLAERVRDPRLVEVAAGDRDVAGEAGTWFPAASGRRGSIPAGEVLFTHAGRRRIVTGPHPDLVAAPGAATVAEVHPGAEIVLDLHGIGIPGSALLGDPGHGPLVLLPGDPDGRIVLDVAHAGAIVVLPGRADAETLTRARAMGIAGAVVPALAERDRRDVAASEVRQRAGLHRLASFPVLVVDGFVRRALAGPVRDLLRALEGLEVGLAGNPPLLVAPATPDLPRPAADRVRIRGGREAGAEGRFLGPAGPYHFGAGVVLEAARVALDTGRTVVVPLGDLERFA